MILARADEEFRRASSLQIIGKFHAAYRYFSKAFNFYKSHGDIYGQVQSAHQAGDMARQIEQFSLAITWYEKSLKLLPHWKNSFNHKYQSRTDAIVGMALAYRGNGEFSRAIRFFHQVERRYKIRGDEEGVAYALWAKGTTHRFQGQFGRAEKALRCAIKTYQALKDSSGLAYALAGLGGTLRMQGRAIESGKMYKKANRIFSQLGDNFGVAYTFCGQGNALRMQNRWIDSLVFMNKAIKLYTTLKQKGPRGFVLWSRAQTHILLRHFALAKRDLRSAQKLFSEVKDRRGLVYCDLGWGEYWRHQNDSRAVKAYRRAHQNGKRQGLIFEAVHALRFLNPSQKWPSSYRKFDVDSRAFFRYRSLP